MVAIGYILYNYLNWRRYTYFFNKYIYLKIKYPQPGQRQVEQYLVMYYNYLYKIFAIL